MKLNSSAPDYDDSTSDIFTLTADGSVTTQSTKDFVLQFQQRAMYIVPAADSAYYYVWKK
jgi:hypothetical protein